MSAGFAGHAGLTVLTGLADEAAIVTGARALESDPFKLKHILHF